MVDAIAQLKPDLVFISNTYRPILRDRPDVDDGAIRYAQGQLSIIKEFAPAVSSIYVLAPPPPGKALAECATTFSAPADCVSGIPDDWRRFNDAMAQGPDQCTRTSYVDTSSWFCTSDGRCPSFAGGTPVRRDAIGHIVPAYAQKLAPVLDQLLAKHGR